MRASFHPVDGTAGGIPGLDDEEVADRAPRRTPVGAAAADASALHSPKLSSVFGLPR